MKKLFISPFLAAALMTVGLAPPIAQAAPVNNAIQGYVSYRGQPAAGVRIQILCPDQPFTKFASTDATGFYRAVLTPTQCPIGANLRVSAGLDGGGRIDAPRWGIIISGVEGPVTRLDFALFDAPVPVPEYGWLGGSLPAVAAASAIALTRRRHAKLSAAKSAPGL